jgi:hypothetical protein
VADDRDLLLERLARRALLGHPHNAARVFATGQACARLTPAWRVPGRSAW